MVYLVANMQYQGYNFVAFLIPFCDGKIAKPKAAEA